MSFLLVLLAVFALYALWMVADHFALPGTFRGTARRRAARIEAQRARAPTGELVAEARALVRYCQWQDFDAAGALRQDGPWTDAKLLEVLRALYAAVADDDRARGRSGRDSHVFEFHDAGLASICRALEGRQPG